MKRSSLLFVAGFVAINIAGFGTLRAAANDDFDAQLKRAMEFSLAESSLVNQLPQDQPNQIQQNDGLDDDLNRAIALSLKDVNYLQQAIEASKKEVQQAQQKKDPKKPILVFAQKWPDIVGI